MFKALIVGCGKIAGANDIFGSMTHGGAYASQSNIDLVAAVDRDSIKARQFAELSSCAYSSELIPSLELYAPDVVSVNDPMRKLFRRSNMKIDALLPERFFLDGNYVDLVVASISIDEYKNQLRVY